MDVVTAFLNGTLEENIHATTGRICPTRKTKDGLQVKEIVVWTKTISRCWNKEFKEHMESANFKQSTADPCIFTKTEESGEIIIVAVYVDDLIIVTKTNEKMNKIKRNLTSRFK